MEGEKLPAVHIMANRYRGTIYVGVTSQLWNRVTDHKNSNTPGFTSEHGCKLPCSMSIIILWLMQSNVRKTSRLGNETGRLNSSKQ